MSELFQSYDEILNSLLKPVNEGVLQIVKKTNNYQNHDESGWFSGIFEKIGLYSRRCTDAVLRPIRNPARDFNVTRRSVSDKIQAITCSGERPTISV